MEMKTLIAASVEELRVMLQEKRSELGRTEFELRMGELKNNQQIKIMKKDVARILTALEMKSTPSTQK